MMNKVKRQSLYTQNKTPQKIQSLIMFWNDRKKRKSQVIYFKHFPYIYNIDNQIHIRFSRFQEWYTTQSKRKASHTIQKLRNIALVNDPQCKHPPSFRDFMNQT